MKLSRWYRQRVHVSWLIAAMCAGFLGGVGLALVPQAAVFSRLTWLVTAGLMLVTALAKRRAWMIILALGGGLFDWIVAWHDPAN